MKLLFINELGPNYKNENTYEFIFGENLEEIWGDDWDANRHMVNQDHPKYNI